MRKYQKPIFLHTIFYELTLAADFRKLVLGATAALSKAFVDAFLVRFAPGVTTIDVCFPKVGDRLAKADLADDDEAFFAIRFVDSWADILVYFNTDRCVLWSSVLCVTKKNNELIKLTELTYSRKVIITYVRYIVHSYDDRCANDICWVLRIPKRVNECVRTSLWLSTNDNQSHKLVSYTSTRIYEIPQQHQILYRKDNTLCHKYAKESQWLLSTKDNQRHKFIAYTNTTIYVIPQKNQIL